MAALQLGLIIAVLRDGGLQCFHTAISSCAFASQRGSNSAWVRAGALLSGVILLTFRRSLAVIDALAEIAQGELGNKFSRRPRASGDDGVEVHKIIPDSSAQRREPIPRASSDIVRICMAPLCQGGI